MSRIFWNVTNVTISEPGLLFIHSYYGQAVRGKDEAVIRQMKHML